MLTLDSKYHKYLELIKEVQDEEGFIESHECDSLLFSGLVGCIPDVKINIMAAYDGERWHRRPLAPYSMKPCCGCWDPDSEHNKESQWSKIKRAAKYLWEVKGKYNAKELQKILTYKGSTISRDMLVGLAWYAWRNKRLDISESVIKYALKHWGVMGDGDPSRINIMPGLFATFCWISYRLGGPSRSWARFIKCDSGADLVDYQAHLQVLHILLRQELTGKLSFKDQKTLQNQASRQPDNPLFQYAVGRPLKALSLLNNEALWPSDRLPTREDRYTQWIPMRDSGDDWKGDKGDTHKHSGGDFLFVYHLIRRKP